MQDITSKEEHHEVAELQIGKRWTGLKESGLSPADIADLRNELCLLCGKYKTAHLGSCSGCRWRKA